MNPKYIDINAYKKWRDARRAEHERAYSDWIESGNKNVSSYPQSPDLSLQTYIEHLIDSMPNQGH